MNPKAKARVLLVEDDAAVAELVRFHVERAGFEVAHAPSAEAAWELLAAPASVDVVVLDRMLPGASGLDTLRRLRTRAQTRDLPVLLLTARATEADRVEGLESGADDYLVKPFGAGELVARIRALLRRVDAGVGAGAGVVAFGPLRVDRARARVRLDGRELDLTRREFDLLAFLAANPGRVFSRAELLDRVWGPDFLGTERTVDQHVAQLRAHLGEGWIETLRGRGYRLPDPPPETT